MMQVLIRELVLRLNYSKRDLIKAAAGRLGLTVPDVRLVRIVRRSVDARPIRQNPCYIINATFLTTRPVDCSQLKKVDPVAAEPTEADTAWTDTRYIHAPGKPRPVVVGAGPAGLLAAYLLAKAGARPLLLERGQPIAARRPAVGAFWGRGELDPENNVLYGEGGAGAFSDGKLTSRSKDVEGKDFVLSALVECGAPETIRYDAQAHLGSDVLARVIPALRTRIEELGGEIRFGARLDGLLVKNGALRGIRSGGTDIECTACILATGHSAGDVYRLLARSGVQLESKGYALGVRVELPQKVVDRSQWGRFAGRAGLGAASFLLTCGGRCHSFCMCPGGSVIACAQSPGLLGTNGMSLSTRAGGFANAAFLVPLAAGSPEIAALADPAELASLATSEHHRTSFADLLGLEALERRIFAAGGGDYTLPASTLADFLSKNESGRLPDERSCRRSLAANLHTLLPERVADELSGCIPQMLNKLGRIAPEEIVLYGAETRSTSAVRVVRGDDGQSVTLRGLFPAGEGAGYAGGIVSSAIDGVRSAHALLSRQPS